MEKYIFGIDVGGTNIKIGVFNYDSVKNIKKFEVKTSKSKEISTILFDIKKFISEYVVENNINWNQVVGIGLGVPCPVKNGYVEKCANLSVNETNLIDELRRIFPGHITFAVGNDATLAALGENQSLAKPYDNAVLITLGTGVGGGIIVNGQLVEGSSGFGGEIGHIKVYDELVETCGCGSKGCLEQICGTAAIIKYAKKAIIGKKTILNLETLNVKRIFDAAKMGDEVGLETVNRVAKYLGIAASILAITVEPDVFIIGGGISKAGPFFTNLVQKYFRENARFSTGKIPFQIAITGNDAGMIGSALLVKHQMKGAYENQFLW